MLVKLWRLKRCLCCVCSVVAVRHNPRSVGDHVTMLLMCRERGSLVATPIGQSECRTASQLLSVSETALDTVYSKLLLATPIEVSRNMLLDYVLQSFQNKCNIQ